MLDAPVAEIAGHRRGGIGVILAPTPRTALDAPLVRRNEAVSVG